MTRTGADTPAYTDTCTGGIASSQPKGFPVTTRQEWPTAFSEKDWERVSEQIRNTKAIRIPNAERGMFREVKQRNQSDCVIAAIANACGLPYRTVRERWGGTTRGGLALHEIEWLLGEFADWTARNRTDKRPRINPGEWARGLTRTMARGRYVVLVVSDPFASGGPELHAVSVVGRNVHGHYADMWHVCRVYKITRLHANDKKSEKKS